MKIVCIHYETIDAYYAEMALNSTRHHLRQPFKVHSTFEFISEILFSSLRYVKAKSTVSACSSIESTDSIEIIN